MNIRINRPGGEHYADLDPFADPLDTLLAEIAIAVQLPPSLHEKATDRYAAVRRHMERAGSPLQDGVSRFYPQGSMAIDATISNRGTDDEYDLDVVAELALPLDTAPSDALDLVHRSLADYPVRKVERQTRCVTLFYSDQMHLDVTPAVMHGDAPDRQSTIFHAKLGEPTALHKRVPMNAWAFARWYEARTPLERIFSDAYNRRLFEHYGIMVKADAEVDEVPDQTPLKVKSVATVALQLLKRFRNVAYATYAGRIPPSVMLSCFAGHVAVPNMRLSDMLIRLATTISTEIRRASGRGERLHVENPEYRHDVFTDRWPESLRQQDEFASKLEDLVRGLEAIRAGRFDLEDIQAMMRGWFGKSVVTRVVDAANERQGSGIRQSTQSYAKSGRVFVPAAPSLVGIGASLPSSASAAASPHTFMGERKW